jgi:fatty-acyl-CoA synthase
VGLGCDPSARPTFKPSGQLWVIARFIKHGRADLKDLTPYRDELTPVSFVERAGTVYASRPAVVEGSATYTWRQFRARSRRFAWALRAAELKKHDRVALLAFNSEALLLAHFGVLQAGGVLVAINTRITPEEVAYIVSHSGSRLIVFSSDLAPALSQIPSEVRRIEIGSEFEAFLAGGSEDPVETRLDSEDELCAIDYTSGTTGRPKGVMYHHRGAFLNALAMVVENRLTVDSSHLWSLPMFHCNGWSHTWAMAAAGSKSVCIPRIDPSEIWRLLDDEAVTHFNAAPTVLIMLVNDPAAHRLERRVRVCTGGAPPSPTLISQMASLNIELVHLYGLTETYGPLTLNVNPIDSETWSLSQQAEYRARQGFAHVVAGSVRVVDEQMHEVTPDGVALGEVVARGNTLMRGYYDQPDATDEAFRGGWLHTGDVGVMHPDGSIELRDRKKDIIISGGENISTIEVEQAVATHPAVMEVAVIAIPDEKWGEVPKAFVVLKPGVDASEGDIIEHVRGLLAHFKAPKSVAFGELPKTSTGKVQKFVLRDREWSGRQRRIN